MSEGRLSVTVEVEIAYGHRLFNYNGKCSRLHGHNARVIVAFGPVNQLDAQGMVQDFTSIKPLLREMLQEIDHRMLLYIADPLARRVCDGGMVGVVRPDEIVMFDQNPTAEVIAAWIFRRATNDFSLPVKSVTLYETEKCSATYEKE